MVSEKELERRRKISESVRASPSRQAYYDRVRGQPRSPNSPKTKAVKSASHQAERGTREWEIYYELALGKLHLEEEAEEQLEDLREEEG